MGRDWQQWHRHYDRQDPSLLLRLEAVRRDLRQALAQVRHTDEVIHLTSICAGDGRDVLPVLAESEEGGRVRATLVELDPVLADRARTTAAELGLSGVDVRTADAGVPDTYRDVPRADVLTICGVFGNITVEDVRQTITALPGLLAAEGIVIWTRGVQGVDRTPDIRATFAANGFAEMSFTSTTDGVFRVGMHRLTGDPAVDTGHDSGARMFAFV